MGGKQVKIVALVHKADDLLRVGIYNTDTKETTFVIAKVSGFRRFTKLLIKFLKTSEAQIALLPKLWQENVIRNGQLRPIPNEYMTVACALLQQVTQLEGNCPQWNTLYLVHTTCAQGNLYL